MIAPGDQFNDIVASVCWIQAESSGYQFSNICNDGFLGSHISLPNMQLIIFKPLHIPCAENGKLCLKAFLDFPTLDFLMLGRISEFYLLNVMSSFYLWAPYSCNPQI